MRGVVYAGLALVGVAALSAVTQQVVPRAAVVGSGLDLDDFGQKFDDLLPYALFTLLPILGVVIVLAVGALAAKPDGSGTRPNITPGFLFAFFGLGMILVGMLGGALLPITDLGLQGTVFEEASLVYVVYGGVLGALGGARLVAAEVRRAHGAGRRRRRPRPARRAGHDPRRAAVLHRRVRRPAGGVGHVRLRAGRPRCGTSPSPSATR